MIYLYAFGIAFTAALIAFIFTIVVRGSAAFRTSFTTTVVAGVINLLIITFAMPDFSFFPGGGWASLFFIDLILTIVIAWFMNDGEKPSISVGIASSIVFAFWAIYMILGFPGYYLDNRGNDFIASLFVVEQADTHIPSTNLEELIQITEHNALYKAGQAMGSESNLGSYLQPHATDFQHVGGELVAPVDFQVTDRASYRGAGETIPGYILVSVTNPNAEAQLMTGYDIKFAPNAWWTYDLDRCVYFDYLLPNRIKIADNLNTLELDDEGKPFYTATTLSLEHGWRAPVPNGVIVVDPTDCNIDWYPLDEVPEWIDIIWPRYLVEKYAEHWARYSNWDACLIQYTCGGKAGMQDVDEVNHIITAHDQAFQITVTSPNSDQSSTGMIHFDPLTGVGTMYNYTGPTLTAVDEKVEEQSVSLLEGTGYLSEECELHWLLDQHVAYCILVSHDISADYEGEIDPRSLGGYAFIPVAYTSQSNAIQLSDINLTDAYSNLEDFIVSVALEEATLSGTAQTVTYKGSIELIGIYGEDAFFTVIGSRVPEGISFRINSPNLELAETFAYTLPGHEVIVTAQQVPNNNQLVVISLYNQTIGFPPQD